MCTKEKSRNPRQGDYSFLDTCLNDADIKRLLESTFKEKGRLSSRYCIIRQFTFEDTSPCKFLSIEGVSFYPEILVL